MYSLVHTPSFAYTPHRLTLSHPYLALSLSSQTVLRIHTVIYGRLHRTVAASMVKLAELHREVGMAWYRI